MNSKLLFGAGLGLGYVLGTRAGRERYNQIRGKAKQIWESKTVRGAVGAVQRQAGRLHESGKHVTSEQSHQAHESRPTDQLQKPSEQQAQVDPQRYL